MEIERKTGRNDFVEVVGIDPGFSALGYAALKITSSEMYVDRAGVITTKPSERKRKVRKSDDNVRRILELAAEIERAAFSHNVVAVCSESMSWPRSSSACAKLGMAWGIVGTYAHQHRLPVLQVTPMELKRAACNGNGKASKDEVIAAMVALFGDSWLPRAKTRREHVADAIGAVWACMDSTEIKMARKMIA